VTGSGVLSGALAEEVTLRKIRMVRTEGSHEVARDIANDNLDAKRTSRRKKDDQE